MVEGPWYVGELSPKVHHCMGGLVTGLEGRVIDVGTVAILDCLVFGCLAGMTAAKEKAQRPPEVELRRPSFWETSSIRSSRPTRLSQTTHGAQKRRPELAGAASSLTFVYSKPYSPDHSEPLVFGGRL